MRLKLQHSLLGLAALLLSGNGDAGALWTIVHDHCVPNEWRHADPAPCTIVDLQNGESRGFALLKDRVGVAQYLLIPTARIAGIESPVLLQPGMPNYFALAWDAHRLLDARLGRAVPRNAIALAVNGRDGRSQDQLHIHLDCIRQDVRAALQSALPAIGSDWLPLPVLLRGHRYRALYVPGDELSVNPFRLLAGPSQELAAEMGQHSLVVVGVEHGQGPGFILLDRVSDGDTAHGEELQDHDCAAVLRP